MALHCRRLVRLFCCLLALAVVAPATFAADPAKTIVNDTLYRADGLPASGKLLISWPAFVTPDGKPVAAGNMSITIGAGGAINLPLVPTQGATPAGSYYKVVLKLDDGASSTEYWSVPALSPTTIAAIRSAVVPASVAMQVVSREYVDTADAGSVHKAGDETIAGAKTFSVSPMVPTPDIAEAAANKEYVDQAAAGGGSMIYPPSGVALSSGSAWLDSIPLNNVKAYGATGLGVVDDHEAILAAYNALPAAGGDLYFPPGTYLVGSGLSISKKVRITCAGADSAGGSAASVATLKKSAAATEPVFTFTTDSEGSVVNGCTIDGVVGNAGDGIVIAAPHITLNGTTVFHQGGNGIRIGVDAGGDNANWPLLNNVVSTANTGSGIYGNDNSSPAAGAPNCNAGTIVNPSLQINGGDGIKIGNCVGWTITGGSVERNTGCGIHYAYMGRDNSPTPTVLGVDVNEANTAGNYCADENTNVGIYLGPSTTSTFTPFAVPSGGMPDTHVTNVIARFGAFGGVQGGKFNAVGNSYTGHSWTAYSGEYDIAGAKVLDAPSGNPRITGAANGGSGGLGGVAGFTVDNAAGSTGNYLCIKVAGSASCQTTWRGYNNGTGYLSSSGSGGLYLNWDAGTGGTNFGNGTNGVVASVNSSGKGTFNGGLASNKLEKGGTLLSADASCAAGDYWLAPITGASNKWRKCQNGATSDMDYDLRVNAASAVGANLSDIDPAAPANALNIKWQLNSATNPDNLSAYLAYAAPLTVATGNLTVSTGSTAGTVAAGDDPRIVNASGSGACTNQFVRVANAGAAPTCASVATADLSDAAVTTSKVSAALRTRGVSFTLENPGTSDVVLVLDPGQNVTITRLQCAVKAATSAAIRMYKTSEADLYNTGAGTAVHASDLTCSAGGGNTSTFTSAAVPTHTPVMLKVNAVSGSPGWLAGTLEYTLDVAQ